jgi:hypothetical protein
VDHQTLVGSLGLLILANILGIWRVTASQNKRFDDRFSQMQTSFNSKFLEAERNVNEAFETVSNQFALITNQITKILEGDIREFRIINERLREDLEVSRKRVHDLAVEMSVVVLKVDRLERPHQ